MKEIIAQNGGLIGTILAAMLALNALLSGVKMIMQVILPNVEQRAANPVLKAVGSVMDLLNKGIDMIQGNVKH